MTKIPDNYLPTAEEVEKYLISWKENGDANDKELALNKLFFDLCPENKVIQDVLIKCSTLNGFYSTNIYDIYSVAQHILKLNIDERLRGGDLSLVDMIARVKVGNPPKERRFYSFATKYCSHHQPQKYAIYDSYVEKLLWDFQNRDKFSDFKLPDLKDYTNYMRAIYDFQKHYELEQFSVKNLDQYLWQLGKKYYSQYGLDNKRTIPMLHPR
jgi:hypothetical protein